MGEVKYFTNITGGEHEHATSRNCIEM